MLYGRWSNAVMGTWLLLSITPAHAAYTRCVQVNHARMRLGDVLPNTPAPWDDIDLGHAPAPLGARRIDASEIRERVAEANLQPLPTALPAQLRVCRSGQQVRAPELQQRVRQALEQILPQGSHAKRIHVTGSVVLPTGAYQTQLNPPRQWFSGRQNVNVELWSDQAETPVSLSVDVDISLPSKPTAVAAVSRGSTVTIIAEGPGVRVQSNGVAQEGGALGESIAVLPSNGMRVVRGRIRDAHTVEVDL